MKKLTHEERQHEDRKPQTGQIRRISALVPNKLHKQLRKYAFKARASQGEVIREALTQFFNK